MFEVFSTETMSSYSVRLDTSTCECAEWQMSGIPCGHALAVSLELGTDPQIYAKPFYKLTTYRQTYSNAIFPRNAINADPVLPEEDPHGVHLPALLPPNIHRQVGKPRKVRIRGGLKVVAVRRGLLLCYMWKYRSFKEDLSDACLEDSREAIS